MLGGIWDQSEREQMVPRDTIAGLLTQFLALLEKKKINNVFWCFVTLPGDVPLLGARRDARHRGNAAATPPPPKGHQSCPLPSPPPPCGRHSSWEGISERN